MRRTLPLSLAALAASLLVGCSPQTATQPTEPETPPVAESDAPLEGGHGASLVPMLTCDPNAMLSAASTKAALIAAHGAENIREQKVPWVDSQVDAAILFPDDPAMRAEVLWLIDPSGAPDAARVSGGPESLWVGPEGLLLGASLADVEAANGGPFMMTAFGNHNHGEVSDFLGGKLAGPDNAACRVSFTLDANADTPETALTALSGDSEKSFRSDDPAVQAARPVITEMSILFFKP
jgi:hypothetical protein